MEIRLTQVARASLKELRLDHEDFLRQRRLTLWPRDDPRRAALIARRCQAVEELAAWVRETHAAGRSGQSGHGPTPRSTSSTPSTYPEIAANAALILIKVAAALLDRQVASQAAAFEKEGGFTEHLYRIRTRHRGR